jgi:serine/threonine-protein kinase HipA
MVFNVLAHNRDDHVKNFAFLLDDATGQWSLSPAYDLLYTPGPGGEHTMTVAGEGRAPGRAQMLTLAERAGIPRRDADRIIEEVRSAVGRWKRLAARAGISPDSIHRIARSLPRLG